MINLTARIVAAYLGNNPVAASEIPDLIKATYNALASAAAPAAKPAEPLQPSVPIRKSVTPDAIICLECGRPQKMLKRHLASAHGLTVDDYRSKWSLPADYPMVAPNYAEHRSQLAVKIGLGRKKAAPAAAGDKADTDRTDVEKADVEKADVDKADADSKPRHQYPLSRWSRSAE
ncbi:MAG: MucR family transcriptional regulator [Telmatospirillum sp.]|nr:MucR family transcriptional regulator [Telmatospirillum sp.]